MSVQSEIDRATAFGQAVEALVVRKGQCPTNGDREMLLLAYWSLMFDFHKGILALLSAGYYGAAFALVRPVMEALFRAHLTLMGTDEEILQLRKDEYRTNFKDIAPRIDEAFGLHGMLERIMDRARLILHSYTHAGLMQIGRRFDGNDLKQNYGEQETIEVIRSTTSMAWMVTNLVTKHFKFEDEWKAGNDLFSEWGKV